MISQRRVSWPRQEPAPNAGTSARAPPEEVSQLSTAIPSPRTTAQALGMLRAALEFLNTADATAMAAQAQAECLQALEQSDAMVTAARASILAAFAAGQGHRRSRSGQPDHDRPDETFEDRAVPLETTLDGAGVLHANLTPECAAALTAVLDALSAPAEEEDTRSHEQRYHDGLQEAMQRLLAAGLLPERAGQPVKAWVHISLTDLMMLGGQLGAAGGVDRPDPRPVGRAPGRSLGGRRPRRRVAGRGRRRLRGLRRLGHAGSDRGDQSRRLR